MRHRWSDEELKQLAQIKNLSHLLLAYTRVTDAGLSASRSIAESETAGCDGIADIGVGHERLAVAASGRRGDISGSGIECRRQLTVIIR